MSHDDFAFEPVRGLPATLPEGERLLWQGAPDWRALAVRGFHARKAAIYFLALVAWRLADGIAQSQSAGTLLRSCGWLALLGAAAVALLTLLAVLSARCAVFSITNRRVLIRHGIAVQLTLDVPFTVIQAADYKPGAGGRGDIALTVATSQRVGYLVNWPYVRPGRLLYPQPSLRALADAQAAAEVLGAALAAAAGGNAARASTDARTEDLGRHPAMVA